MTLLDRVLDCNNATLNDFIPLCVRGQTVGWVSEEFSHRLLQEAPLIIRENGSIVIQGGDRDYDALSSAVDEALFRIYSRDNHGFGKWCGERTPVVAAMGQQPLFEVERAALPTLGIISNGVHLNGFVGEGADLSMWVSRRGAHLASQPNLLDQIVAGFLPVGGSTMDKLCEEADEEAGIPQELMRMAQPTGGVTFLQLTDVGVRKGFVFTYDLRLPSDFVPHNKDGEVGEFLLLKPREVLDMLASGPCFKFDSALVAIDFMMRRGFVPPEHNEYATIVTGLRGVGV
ncbi:NUDIX hydrolase [Magnetovibrio sp.]|uniref:NUDIX hydrolase n=1 Tax=Magnetovibrio sp. TaxID=2024836 RepID=UPI002F9594E5